MQGEGRYSKEKERSGGGGISSSLRGEGKFDKEEERRGRKRGGEEEFVTP